MTLLQTYALLGAVLLKIAATFLPFAAVGLAALWLATRRWWPITHRTNRRAGRRAWPWPFTGGRE
jgi:hypothetical protein